MWTHHSDGKKSDVVQPWEIVINRDGSWQGVNLILKNITFVGDTVKNRDGSWWTPTLRKSLILPICFKRYVKSRSKWSNLRQSPKQYDPTSLVLECFWENVSTFCSLFGASAWCQTFSSPAVLMTMTEAELIKACHRQATHSDVHVEHVAWFSVIGSGISLYMYKFWSNTHVPTSGGPRGHSRWWTPKATCG